MTTPPPATKTAIGFKDWYIAGLPIRLPNGVQNQGTAPARIDLSGDAFTGEWDESRKVFVIKTAASVLPSGDVKPTPDTVLIRGSGGEGKVQWIELYGGDPLVASDGQIRLGTELGPILQAPNDDSSGQMVLLSREGANRFVVADTEKVVTTAIKARDAIVRYLASDSSEREHSRLLPEVSGLPAGPVTQYASELGPAVSAVIPSSGSWEVWQNPASPTRIFKVQSDGAWIFGPGTPEATVPFKQADWPNTNDIMPPRNQQDLSTIYAGIASGGGGTPYATVADLNDLRVKYANDQEQLFLVADLVNRLLTALIAKGIIADGDP